MHDFRTRGDFVGDENIEFGPAPQEEYDTPGILIAGEIGCKGNLILSVKKFLEILSDPEQDDPEVETRVYSYHARVKDIGRELGSIFQYDNHHPCWLYPGHKDPHHKHSFDWRTGEELKSNGSPEWKGADSWPFMHEVINELREWYYDHYSELPYPEEFPEQLGYPR